MNTRSKRASAIGVLAPFIVAPPTADGSISAGDRRHAAWMYAGVLAPIEPEVPPIIGPTGAIVRVFSDLEMNCPAEWYNGPKDARVMRTGFGERMLSDIVTGEPTSSTFSYRLADKDFLLRRALASQDQRYWPDPVTIHMTTRDNRAALGRAYLVFVGPIIDAQPARPLAWDITLGDLVTHRLITDRAVHPSRKIGDGFIHDTATNALGTRVQLSSALDYELPEAEIYGPHRRVRTYSEDIPGDPPSEHGFEIDVTDHYLGIWNIDGGDKHVWILCGHAVADIPDVNTVAPDGTHQSVAGDEGSTWWFPHGDGWDAIFGAPYVDVRSTSFGVDRRYSLILSEVGHAPADACAYSSGGYPMDTPPDVPLRLMVMVDGMEDVGDGSGTMLYDHADCYLDWWNNYGSRSAAESYQAGPRLGPPTFTLIDRDGTAQVVPAVDEASFARVKAINQIRMPALNGYPCAAIIGARPGDIYPMSKWRADWNRSGFVVDGWTRKMQLTISTPHPSEAVKSSARLYTDALEMREGTFEAKVRWGEQANRMPFRNDPDYTTGRMMTSGIVDAGDSILNYGEEILGEVRDFPFAPGITMGTHLAFLHVWLFKHKPISVIFEDTVGPDPDTGESLGYEELGGYFKYRHYAAVGSQGQIRLAWITRMQVLAGRRRVLAEGWDLEDLKDFDIPATVVETVNETCELAIVIPNGADEPYSVNLDTTEHATDAAVAGIAGLPGPAVGYHAAHFAWTAPGNGTLFLTTVHSLYDTQIAVCTGACGSLELVEGSYNDNDGILTTSVLEVPVTSGTTYRIVVYGYGPDDGGALTFGLLFTATP